MIFAVVLWVRRLRREPATVSAFTASLAVGLAGILVALALSGTVLWRELPFRNAERLVKLDALNAKAETRWLSLPEFGAITEELPSTFAAICGYTVADFAALSDPPLRTQPLLATMVTPQFFDVFGIRPALGALPDPQSYTAGERVVLLSHDLWMRRYNGAVDIIGRPIRLGGPDYLPRADGAYRVIGVLPRELWLFWKQADIVLPLRSEPPFATNAGKQILEHVVAQLSEEADLAAARTNAGAIVRSIASVGARDPVAAVNVRALTSAHYRDLRPQLLTILTIAIVVLTLAALNVALAATAQAASRSQEMAIRVALGAAASRLLRDNAFEQTVSAACAGALGSALGLWLTPLIAARVPRLWLARMPGEATAVRLDVTTWLILLGVLVVVILIASVIAQTVIRRARPSALLSSTSARNARESTRLRAVLVAAEVALCVCAVGVGGTSYLQLRALQRIGLGVESDRAFALWLNVGSSKHSNDAERADYYAAILARARGVPGIESVGGVSLPFHFNWQTIQVRREAETDAAAITAFERSATEQYLDASGIRLVHGRWFDARDRRGGANTIVVSESVARALWPGSSPLGETLRLTNEDSSPDSTAVVVGVVRDTRRAPQLPPDRTVFLPVSQVPPPWLYLVAKHRPQDADASSALMDAIWSLDPDLAIDGPWPIAKWIDDRTVHLRFVVLLTGLLAAVGAVLCSAGLYSLTSHWVGAASTDLGVRRAVGAADAHIAAWFGRQWAAIVAPGLVLGLALQFAVLRVLVSGIEGMREPSWFQAAIGCIAVTACALCGAGIPLRRALRAAPTSLLRS